jgi:hypothetical protein
LHDDGHIRLEDRVVVGVARNGLRIDEVVEAQVQGPARRDRDQVWPRRRTVREIDGKDDVGIAVAGIENAGGLL